MWHCVKMQLTQYQNARFCMGVNGYFTSTLNKQSPLTVFWVIKSTMSRTWFPIMFNWHKRGKSHKVKLPKRPHCWLVKSTGYQSGHFEWRCMNLLAHTAQQLLEPARREIGCGAQEHARNSCHPLRAERALYGLRLTRNGTSIMKERMRCEDYRCE